MGLRRKNIQRYNSSVPLQFTATIHLLNSSLHITASSYCYKSSLHLAATIHRYTLHLQFIVTTYSSLLQLTAAFLRYNSSLHLTSSFHIYSSLLQLTDKARRDPGKNSAGTGIPVPAKFHLPGSGSLPGFHEIFTNFS